MSVKILQKCIEELQKERPNVDKVIGMLETLVEMSGTTVVQQVVVAQPTIKSTEVKEVETPKVPPHPEHGTLTMETPEERKIRLDSRSKVPPAFLGNIGRMGMDPAKTDGKTDVTPFL